MWRLYHVSILGRHKNVIEINWHFTEKSVLGQRNLAHFKWTVWIYMTMATLHWLSVDLLWNWNKLTLIKTEPKSIPKLVCTTEHYLAKFPHYFRLLNVDWLVNELLSCDKIYTETGCIVLTFPIWSTSRSSSYGVCLVQSGTQVKQYRSRGEHSFCDQMHVIPHMKKKADPC